MNDSTNTANSNANFVRLAGRDKERHLLLVTTQSSSRLQTLKDLVKGHVVLLTDGKIQIRAQYVDGPLLREHESPWWPPITFSGVVGHGCTFETDAWSHTVRLSDGFVVIDPLQLRGLGLGKYLFAQVVLWAKEVAPQGDIQPIKLTVNQAREAKARDLRNGFYERFGFTFDYRTVEGIERAEGSSFPIKVRDLQVPGAFPQLEVLPLSGFLTEHFKQLRVERGHIAGEIQRYERVVADHIALHRETNWIVALGRWFHRTRHQKMG